MQGCVGNGEIHHIDFTKAQAQARAVAVAINHEGMLHPTFARASQNVATAATIFDTLLVPSTNGVSKVYRQLKDIFDVATELPMESLLQRWADVSF
jgi:hypothetical protein